MRQLHAYKAVLAHLADLVKQDRVHELLLDVPVCLLGRCTASHGTDH